MTVNKVILVGRLGRDPESRTAQGGLVIANLNLATDERRKDKDGNWAKHTEWHRVTLFNRDAENALKFLKKGSQVYVEGKLRTSKYNDKEGVERYSTDVIADVVRFLDSRGGGEGEGGEGGGGGRGGYGGGGGGGSAGGRGGYGGGGGGGGRGGGGDYGGGGGGGGGGYDDDGGIPF
jgi:single-strand DNA-binding protein